MDTEKAIDVIEMLGYKPGWTFRAMASDAVQGVVVLYIEADVPDSSKHYAPDYRSTILACRTFYLDAESAQVPADIYRMVFECVCEMEMHETREFFGMLTAGGEWFKPYHPHSIEGRRAWTRLPKLTKDVDGVLVVEE